jgi:hypothetical protein
VSFCHSCGLIITHAGRFDSTCSLHSFWDINNSHSLQQYDLQPCILSLSSLLSAPRPCLPKPLYGPSVCDIFLGVVRLYLPAALLTAFLFPNRWRSRLHGSHDLRFWRSMPEEQVS